MTIALSFRFIVYFGGASAGNRGKVYFENTQTRSDSGQCLNLLGVSCDFDVQGSDTPLVWCVHIRRHGPGHDCGRVMISRSYFFPNDTINSKSVLGAPVDAISIQFLPLVSALI